MFTTDDMFYFVFSVRDEEVDQGKLLKEMELPQGCAYKNEGYTNTVSQID